MSARELREASVGMWWELRTRVLPPDMHLVAALPTLCPCSVPQLVVSAALRMVRASVRRKAGFDIIDLRPIQDVGSAFVPAVRAAAVHEGKGEACGKCE